MGTLRKSAFTAAAVAVFAGSLLVGMSAPAQSVRQAAAAPASLYASHCASCHGAHLEGASGPSLVGPELDDMKIEDLVALIRSTMPLGAPGSLSEPEYSALANYIHASNARR